MCDLSNGVEVRHSFKLIYNEERGKIDLIKLILAYLNLPYEEIRVYPSEIIAYQQLSPFQQLPLLIIDDQNRISHDLPICRYLAELGQLKGSNAFESSVCDMVVEQLRECIIGCEMNKMDIIERTLNGLEKMVSLNGTYKYVVGNKLTWADLAMVNAWEWMINAVSVGNYSNRMGIMKRFPILKAHNDFVRSNSKVQEWFKNQKPLERVKNV